MIRIANRLGLVATKDPKQIEFALKKIIPPDMGSDFCHPHCAVWAGYLPGPQP